MFDRTDRSRIGVWWWTVDKMMLASIFLLMVLGAVLVMAASLPVASRIGLPEQHFVWKQMIFLLPATLIMLITSILGPRTIRALCLLGLVVVSGLMVATLVVGPEVKGATRWLTIGGFRLQPSEFIKPLFAVSCAWLLGLWREQDSFPGWVWASVLAGFVVTLLILQPDIGMTSVVVLTFGFQLFLAGLPLLLVFAAIGLAPLAGWVAYSQFDHVRLRVDKFLEGGSLQTERSIQSFAEGGWFGVGPGDGTVKQYLPDAHADFIFSVAAEEYGLLACLLLIGVLQLCCDPRLCPIARPARFIHHSGGVGSDHTIRRTSGYSYGLISRYDPHQRHDLTFNQLWRVFADGQRPDTRADPCPHQKKPASAVSLL